MQSVEFDPRILKISVEVDGKLNTYEGLAMTATGSKYANSTQNDCTVTIANLNTETCNYILTKTSPFQNGKTPKKIIIEAGRKSYGTFTVYTGNIVESSAAKNADKILTLKCLTANFQKGNLVARSQPKQVPLSRISKQIAQDLGLTLDFQAEDKQIGNYSFNGPALRQVDLLNTLGRINAYVDDDKLIVKNFNEPLKNVIKVLSLESGMINTPEFTEQGIRVKYMLDNTSKLGGALRIKSIVNPSVNGDYTIAKLGFELTSREDPFYWVAEAVRR